LLLHFPMKKIIFNFLTCNLRKLVSLHFDYKRRVLFHLLKKYYSIVCRCHFLQHDKTILIGADPSHIDDRCMRVTIHHCFFNGTRQRHPRVRFAKVHLYNNYIRNWGIYAACAGVEAQVISFVYLFLLVFCWIGIGPRVNFETILMSFVLYVYARYSRSIISMKRDRRRWRLSTLLRRFV